MHACRLWRKQHGINLGNPPAAAAEAALPAAVPAALDGAAEPDDKMHGNLVDSSGEYIDPVVLGGGEVDVTALETQGLTPLQLQTSEEEAFDVSAIVQVTITHVFMPEFRSKVDGKDGYLDKPLQFGGLRDRPTGVPTDRGC
ncbi:hypothetical protein OEZ85_003284 [Tetradesmus obliquus]|uniref:Uncharacterized protein n=1 Tax=Tetradesmus obliquus TaxID=3088 RepID=A0ABY8U042_TETOB|nr:hypothetical protein OEZ85_003284 [Tetradesmus obliquus]